MTKVGGGATLTQGFFIELVITCILCFVLCSVWDKRNAQWGDSTPVRFAIIIGVLSIIGVSMLLFYYLTPFSIYKDEFYSFGKTIWFLLHHKGEGMPAGPYPFSWNFL